MRTSELITALLFMALVGLVCILEASIVIRASIRRFKNKRATDILFSKPAIAVHILIIIGFLCFLYSRFIEPTWIEVNTISIQTPKLKNTCFRIVQISDIHCDKKPLNEDKTVSLINKLSPDIIVFTGDTVNTPKAIPLFKKTFNSMQAKLGKYAVRGNFEVGSRKNMDLYSNNEFKLLEKETVVVEKDGESLYISGLSCDMRREFKSLIGNVPQEPYSIFLHHWSDLVEDIGQANVDLYLCGHTHGGQVALPFYGAMITLSKFGKKYEAGLYHVGKTTLYVNRGLGLERAPAPKVRLLARPEITVFEIQPKR